ncbi:hypothetical protein BCR33DRAFT_261465 [Rhizoclosmatium globosum]|uniref:TRP C-terminal domain-containing protein n=1 Tax=Rhizoclosmatium globosum TaxID=329046 RepID=A0A1Y2C910_9FUNG|nr:hypothetical protein BCR33DRAFT_261465 [Rhizoclosmatium globosum]|eukprot:ORY43426.1 hypothetical protein BCR33DRAFT_261465 [Rhizoclosmatium globosum]
MNVTLEVEDRLTAAPNAYCIIMACAATISFFGFVVLLFLVFREAQLENKRRSSRSSTGTDSRSNTNYTTNTMASFFKHNHHSAATPFNASLIVMSLSLTGVYVVVALMFSVPSHSFAFDIYTTLATIGISFYEAGYVYFSGKRAGPIVQEIFPDYSSFIKVFSQIIPIFLIIQDVPSIVFISLGAKPALSSVLHQIMFALNLTCGVIAISFDLFLLVVFVKFMQKTISTESRVDLRFLIVARYGSMAVSAGIMSLSCFVLYYFFAEVFAVMMYLWLGVVFGVLLQMKVKLQQNERNELEKRLSRAANASRDVENRKTTSIESSVRVGSLSRSASTKALSPNAPIIEKINQEKPSIKRSPSFRSMM